MDARLPLRVTKIEFGSAVFSGDRIRWLEIEHFNGIGRSAMGHSEAQREVICKVRPNYHNRDRDQSPS